MAEEKKKSIFDKAIDAFTNRDEKAAAEAAKKQAEIEEIARRQKEAAMKAEMESAKAAAGKAQAEAEAAKKALDDAKKEAEIQAKAEANNTAMIAAMEAAAEKARAAAAAAKAAAVVKHVWTSEDTYASLALKHYGKFTEPYWRLIYNHNKDIIGNHPNAIRVGLEIEIPPLPDELK